MLRARSIRAGRSLLVIWFVALDILRFAPLRHDYIAEDARVYLAAAKALVAGGDPWAAAPGTLAFAGPPPSLLPFLPFAWMPADLFDVAAMAATIGLALWILHRLSVPPWWLLFPPLFEGIVVVNPNVLVLALLLVPGGAGAVIAKIYAALPLLLLGRWKALMAALVIVLVSAPFLRWDLFFSHDVGATLSSQAAGGYSGWVLPLVLLPVGAVALLLLGRDRAAWWIVPVLWPSTQLHYGVLALPALRPATAAVIAIPVPGMPVLAVALAALLRRADEPDRLDLTVVVRGRGVLRRHEELEGALAGRDAHP